MRKRIPEKELDAIVAVVAAHPEGVQVSAILEGLPAELEKRTLQRRLALLVEQKRLIGEGKGKGRRYRAPAAITGAGSLIAGSAAFVGWGEVYVPLSSGGGENQASGSRAYSAPAAGRLPARLAG